MNKQKEFIGRYQVRGSVGKGAMALVVRGYDPNFNRDVAIKILHRKYATDRVIRERFLREAQSMASLDHPAIVPVYDSGQDGEFVYLVMRFMEGGTLGQRMEAGAITPEQQVQVLERVGSALDHAHRLGLIHRDIKPDNILFDQYDTPFLADFGIVKAVDADHDHTEGMVGTPTYMSPEQVMESATIDGRSDLYSLGIVLFEMVTGDVPYRGETNMREARLHLEAPIPNVRERKAQLARGWQGVFNRALAKEPEKRFATSAELLQAARPLLLGRRSADSPIARWAWLGGLIAILLLVGAAALLLRNGAAVATSELESTAMVATTQAMMAEQGTEVSATITRNMEENLKTQEALVCQDQANFAYRLLGEPSVGYRAETGQFEVAWQIENRGVCPLIALSLYPPLAKDVEIGFWNEALGVMETGLPSGETGKLALRYASEAIAEEVGANSWYLIIEEDRPIPLFEQAHLILPSEAWSEALAQRRKEVRSEEAEVESATATKRVVPTHTPSPTPVPTATLTAVRLSPTAVKSAEPTSNWNATKTVQAQETARAWSVQQTQTAEARPSATHTPPTVWPTKTPPPTATRVPATATPLPPTATVVPPTRTRTPPTATPVRPTSTRIPSTATPVPPTSTRIPPTVTPVPTRVAPTATPIVATAVPATATPLPSVEATLMPTPSGPLDFNVSIVSCNYASNNLDWQCRLQVTIFGGAGGPYNLSVFDAFPVNVYENVTTVSHTMTARRCTPWIHEVRADDPISGQFISKNLYFDPNGAPIAGLLGGACLPPP